METSSFQEGKGMYSSLSLSLSLSPSSSHCTPLTISLAVQVWECRLDPRLKFRVKNDFVQWQMKGAGGETLTYGIRLKDAEVASQVGRYLLHLLLCHVTVM